ncbi:DUF6182 family protein [Lentzea sp. NBC_00516]|uniref:DUF6182 family protein n=1 Tax=Lentzea sp. NBC_00516 TaxID=2903582 RepID=UPI002E81CFDC|nr:DUF6182 family protein [Lentzea sp. NBC_00516]WUD23995.1 DUF6182 family protein [Lentzea sp. NBC_00516]
MFTQELLRAELGRRVQAATAGPDSVVLPPPAPPDLVELSAATQDTSDVAAIAVLREFDPATFARSVVEFASGVNGEPRGAWFGAFTRTLFLAGNPANLVDRFPCDHLAEDGSIAWFGPAPAARTTGLRRLLKKFDGARELALPPVVPIDLPGTGAGTEHRLQVATAGVTMADYLVHVNHVLAEAVLTRVIRPGDRLTLSHVPRLGTATAPYSVLRVHLDTADRTRLRAYAHLTAHDTGCAPTRRKASDL